MKARIVLEVELLYAADLPDLVRQLDLGYPGELNNYPFEVVEGSLQGEADAAVESQDRPE